MFGRFAVCASLVVPGLGQALRGRLGDAALFLWAGLWLHTLVFGMLAGHLPADADAGWAWALGAFSGGFKRPEVVVFTAVTIAIHVTAAWDASRPIARGLAPEPTAP